MFEFMAGFFIAEAATPSGAEINSMEPLVAMILIFLGLCLLALNAAISPDGDVKNTISVIRKYLQVRIKR